MVLGTCTHFSITESSFEAYAHEFPFEWENPWANIIQDCWAAQGPNCIPSGLFITKYPCAIEDVVQSWSSRPRIDSIGIGKAAHLSEYVTKSIASHLPCSAICGPFWFGSIMFVYNKSWTNSTKELSHTHPPSLVYSPLTANLKYPEKQPEKVCCVACASPFML